MHGPRRVEEGGYDGRASLAEKKHRRTVHVHSVLASGAADFEAAPGRNEFAGDEIGALLHEQRFNEYVDGNFDDAGAEVRSLDQRDLKRDRKVGLFGDWMETACHGKLIEWVRDEETSLWELKAVRTEEGVPLVPRPVAIMEFSLKAARGDASVPKGGRPEYRDGPWYKSVNGKRQGQLMKKWKKHAYGRGSYSKSKYKFTTIEQYVSAIRKFYDEELKEY